MFELKPVMRHLLLACGGIAGAAVLPPALAQTTMDRVEITGSAIRRVQQEGPAPVETVTRKDIERTGATSINELIRSIPSIDVFDQGELASNSPSGSGTANFRLRGLDSSNALVLLNGRRLPVNGLYDASGAGAAVDINMIPVSAIDRIEILKDGGSAIYGADAVAGVINIITKRDYQGVEARAGFGESSHKDGKEKNAGLTFGYGDLNKDRFNVLLGLDYLKRDPILRKDRQSSNTVDFRARGGPDARSSFSPTGNVVDPNTGGLVGVPYKPCPPENQGANNICRYDFNSSLLSSYNGADRLSGLGIAQFAITPDIRAFAEVTYAKTKDHFEAHPVPDFFVVPTLNAAQVPFEIPGSPGQIYIAGRFMQGGPRITDRKSTLINTVLGVEGTSLNLDWKFNVGRGESKVTNSDHNYYNANTWFAATSSGQIDPTVSTNDPAFVESLKVNPVRVGKATNEFVNAQVGGQIVQLPGGPLQYATGVSWWRDKLSDQPDPLTQAGDVVGSIQQSSVDASRDAKAVFAELAIPIVPTLEAQAAVRYDKYPGSNATSPKIALKWQALPQFALRTSYTRSFRAPVLKQLFGAREEGALTIVDDAECQILIGSVCPAGGIAAFQVNGSNPDLKPERGVTWNFGAIAEAGPFSGTVDFWRITKKDDITTPTIDTAIRTGHFTQVGARIFVDTGLSNIAFSANSGVDVDVRGRFPGTFLGTLTVRDAITYYTHQATRDSESENWAEFNSTYALPRWRNVATLASEIGPWTTSIAYRTVSGFWDTDNPDLVPTSRWVGTDEEMDVQVQFAGIKNLTITGGVKNVLNHEPPFSLTNASNNRYTQMGFAELYTNRGRFYYASVTYKFW